MRTLPPLNTLSYFEATAKCGTVREAAEQLCISPSAVSHQIAKLEQYLDINLFHRQNKRLILTDAGYNFFKQVEVAFERLEEATRDTQQQQNVETLSISMPPSFSALWLLPQLDEFLALNTNLDLRFVDNLTIDDCLHEIDCGIEYRFSRGEDRFSEKLFEDVMVPLASPEYIKKHNLKRLEDLEGKLLIITERRFHSWKTLLKDYDWKNNCQIISVRYTYQALNAAIYGQGVALGNRINAHQFINDNLLAPPFNIDVAKEKSPSYYFSCREENLRKPKVQSFYNWIQEKFNTVDQSI